MNLHSGLSSKLISCGGLFILIAHHDGFQIFWFVHRICHLQNPWFHYRHVLTHNHSTVLLVCKSRRTIVPLSQWPSVRVLQIRSKNAWLRWIRYPIEYHHAFPHERQNLINLFCKVTYIYLHILAYNHFSHPTGCWICRSTSFQHLPSVVFMELYH